MLTKIGESIRNVLSTSNPVYRTFLSPNSPDYKCLLSLEHPLRTSLSSYQYCCPERADFSYTLLDHSVLATSGVSGFCLGSGGTAATRDDYDIESPISGISASIGNVVYDIDTVNKAHVSYYNMTVTNNNNSEIVIREIGRYYVVLVGNTYGAAPAGTTSTYKESVLIERCVLDNPVTISAGQSGIVRYVQKYYV